jgi:hypothetical protein
MPTNPLYLPDNPRCQTEYEENEKAEAYCMLGNGEPVCEECLEKEMRMMVR